jgi:hypothetical protein
MAAEVVRHAPDKDRLRFLSELLVSFEGVESRSETAASKLLPAITAERDALAAKVVELEPSAIRLPEVTAQYDELKSNFDMRLSEARKELVADAQKKLWAAEAKERAAKETLNSAQSAFGQAGLQLLLDQVKKIVEQHSIPEPDLESLPVGISPMFITIWNRTPTYARIMLGYVQSYKEGSESFKSHAFRILTANLPTWGVVSPNQADDEPLRFEYAQTTESIPDLGIRRECVLALAQKFGCLAELQQRVDQRQAEVLGQHLRQTAADLQAQQIAMTQNGAYGREAINVQPEQAVTSVPLSEHVLGCECSVCSEGTRRRTSLEVVEETF